VAVGRRRSTGYIFHEPSGSFQAAAGSCSAASGGAYTIKLRELPAAADAQREQLVRRSAAKDSSLDILGLDVVWEAEFAGAGWVENWTGQRRQQVGTARELEELAADAGSADVPGGGDQIVARLDPASRAREGEKVELWFGTRKAHLFNPENGAHLTL